MRSVLGSCFAAALLAPVLLAPAPPAKPYEDLAVDLLREYLQIDTTVPPGNELRAALFYKRLLEAEGIKPEVDEFAPGRANLLATSLGLLRVDSARLLRINEVEGVTLASLRAESVVRPGQLVATVKVIPYALPEASVRAAEAAARDGGALLRVDPLPARRVPPGLSAEETVAYERLQFVYQKGIGYGYQLGLRPQTMYGIADSPVGLAAWILDHDIRSYLLIARVFDGQTEGLTRDDILDNITLYWLTNTGVSSARLYWENKLPSFFAPKNVTIPVAVSVFPDELYPAPRSWAERAFPKLIHYNKLDKGGHFAAWEQPQLFSEEVRAGFRPLRK